MRGTPAAGSLFFINHMLVHRRVVFDLPVDGEAEIHLVDVVGSEAAQFDVRRFRDLVDARGGMLTQPRVVGGDGERFGRDAVVGCDLQRYPRGHHDPFAERLRCSLERLHGGELLIRDPCAADTAIAARV